jgi:hypothetical protein
LADRPYNSEEHCSFAGYEHKHNVWEIVRKITRLATLFLFWQKGSDIHKYTSVIKNAVSEIRDTIT